MKFISSIILCLLFIQSGNGQSTNLKPAIAINSASIEGNSYYGRDLMNTTKSALSKKFHVTKSALLKLDVVAIPGKMNTINGMDTYTISEVEVNYTISLLGRPNATKSVSVKCKATNEKEVLRKIGSTVSRDKATRTEILSFIDEYIASHLGTCDQVTQLIDQQLSRNEPEQAYPSIAYYDLAENCTEISAAQELKILDAISAKSCKAQVQQAEILANGASLRELTRATDKLLMVSPDSPCQEDVMRVAKLVSTNAKELSPDTISELNIKLENRQSFTREQWRQYYRNQYYKRYYR